MKVWRSSIQSSKVHQLKLQEAWETPEPLFLNTMQGKKILFLFLALLLPVSIFVFLKLFGKNEFDVPAFYQDKAPIAKSGCDYRYGVPYHVADSLLLAMEGEYKKKLYLVHFSDLTPRLKDEIDNTEVSTLPARQLVRESDVEKLKSCNLIATQNQDLVLVDGEGKIRGYYDSGDREEIDRLLLEVEIILKKY